MHELDLSVFVEETFDIKLPDGETVLHIPKPSERMVIQMVRLQNVQASKPEEQVALVRVLAKMILCENKDGYIVKDDEFSKMSFDMMSAVVTHYSEWMAELQGNPISASHTSPAKKTPRKRTQKQN